MNKNKVIILITVTILMILLISISCYFYFKQNSNQEELAVNGTIVEKTEFSILLVDNNEVEYMIHTNNTKFNVGDYISVYTTDPILETYPLQIKASRIIKTTEHTTSSTKENDNPVLVVYALTNLKANTQITSSMVATKYVKLSEVESLNIFVSPTDVVGKYVKNNINAHDYFHIDYLTSTKPSNNSNNSNNTSTEKESNSNNHNNNSTGNTNSSNSNTTNNTKTEADVVNYFNNLNNNLDSNPKANESSIKKSFVTIIDFLFYGGKIYNKTFSELSDSAKTQVLKAALFIDAKIDNVFPDYKETITSTTGRIYTNIKNKIVSTYLDVTTEICLKNSDVCSQAKSDFQNMKDSFSLSWNFLKDIAGKSIDKLSNWYIIWRET